MMLAVFAIDACMFLVLLGVGIGVMSVETRFAAMSFAFALLSLAWPQRQGKIRRDGQLQPSDLLVLFSVVMLLGNTRLNQATGFVGWSAMGVGFMALLSGLYLSLKAWSHNEWIPQRSEMLAVVSISLSALFGVSALAWGVLKYRSDSAMACGRMDFLYQLLLWVGVWFGLDSRLRIKKGRNRPGLSGWLLNSWLQLAVSLVSAIRILSKVVP